MNELLGLAPICISSCLRACVASGAYHTVATHKNASRGLRMDQEEHLCDAMFREPAACATSAREQRQRQVELGAGLLSEPNDLGFGEGPNDLLLD